MANALAGKVRSAARATAEGRWVRVTDGLYWCTVCGEDVKTGWRWFHNATTSSAFVCDRCVEEVTA